MSTTLRCQVGCKIFGPVEPQAIELLESFPHVIGEPALKAGPTKGVPTLANTGMSLKLMKELYANDTRERTQMASTCGHNTHDMHLQT